MLRIVFSDAPVDESDEDKPGVIIDYNEAGNVLGVELLDASKGIENLRFLDYAVTG